jgi:hypothetical protein
VSEFAISPFLFLFSGDLYCPNSLTIKYNANDVLKCKLTLQVENKLIYLYLSSAPPSIHVHALFRGVLG